MVVKETLVAGLSVLLLASSAEANKPVVIPGEVILTNQKEKGNELIIKSGETFYYFPTSEYQALAGDSIFISGFELGGCDHGQVNGKKLIELKNVKNVRINSNESGLESKLPELKQNYPNPCTGITNIDYILLDSTRVRLIVYDNRGKEVETLVDEIQAPGRYNYELDVSKHESGTSPYPLLNPWKNEVFFYRLVTDDFINSKKIIKEK